MRSVHEVRTFLAGDSATQDVRESQQVAAACVIGGTPFYVIDERYAVSGGQPAASVGLRTLDANEAEQVSWPPRRPPHPVSTGKTEAPAACVTTRSCARSF